MQGGGVSLGFDIRFFVRIDSRSMCQLPKYVATVILYVYFFIPSRLDPDGWSDRPDTESLS